MRINRIALLLGHTCRIVLIVGFGLTTVANARAFEGTAEQREACTPDVFRLCSSEIPDVGRIMACMDANEARLSPGCRAVFQTASLDRPATHRTHRTRYAHYRGRHNLRHYAHDYNDPYASHHHSWARS
jgi:hypothetical protein